MVKKITGTELKNEIVQGTSLVDFSAQWCGPCRMMAPVLEEISNELDGKMKFFNVDIDENEEAAVEYRITNIPALMIAKDGEKVDMLIGFQPKEQLMESLKKYL